MSSLVLGTLSMGLGLFLLAVVLSLFQGWNSPRWHHTFDVGRTTYITVPVWELDTESDARTMRNMPVVSGYSPTGGLVTVPSIECLAIAVVAVFLGWVGAKDAWGRFRVSVLCMTGVALSVLATLAGFGIPLVMSAFY